MLRPAGSAVIGRAGTGQDGDTLSGVAWPDPRFAENGDQTITDRLTGLVWTRDADLAGGPKTWQEALDYIKTLNAGSHLGRSDWRLPNVAELESLVNKQANLAEWLRAQGFRNLKVDYYWSSTTYASYALRVERRRQRRYRGRPRQGRRLLCLARASRGAGSRVPAPDRTNRLQ